MRRAAWGTGYLYAAALVVYIHIRFTGLDFYPPGGFRAFLEGTAERPFAGRMLMPVLVNWLSALVPAPVREFVLYLYRINGPFTDAAAYPAEATFEKLVFAGLALICFAGTGYLLRALVRHYYGWSEPAASAAGLLGILLIPSAFRYTTYIYDPATIVLSCLLAWALARRNDRLLLGAFVLACINKETAIVFIPVLLLFRWRERPRLRAVALAAGLLVIWGVIRGEIGQAMAGRPGPAMEFNLINHNAELFREYRPALLFTALYLGCAVALAQHEWQSKPREVRLGLLLTLLPLAVMALPFGYLDETRAWYDAYPYAFLVVAPTLWQVLGIVAGREAAARDGEAARAHAARAGGAVRAAAASPHAADEAPAGVE
jgi:hypothetical protein